MQWIKNFMTVKQYKFTSTNQHGCRYKQDGFKKVSVAKMICSYDASSAEMLRLVLLSNTLDAPIRYDYNKHEMSIEVVSGEALKECT